MGLIKNNKSINQRHANTINTVSSDEILEKDNKALPKKKLKSYPCTIKVDTDLNNSIKALGVIGKVENAKSFLEWAIQEYVSNNLTEDEIKSYQFIKEQMDTTEMMKRESKKK